MAFCCCHCCHLFLIYWSFDRYAPTVLLLRDFDVFCNSVSGEGLPTDQVGLSSEVASVIREFTEPVAEDEDYYADEESQGDFVSMVNYIVPSSSRRD